MANTNAKAGLMVRESSAPGARFALVNRLVCNDQLTVTVSGYDNANRLTASARWKNQDPNAQGHDSIRPLLLTPAKRIRFSP